MTGFSRVFQGFSGSCRESIAVFAWYFWKKGLISSLPDYLVETLAVCGLLWVLQKMGVKAQEIKPYEPKGKPWKELP